MYQITNVYVTVALATIGGLMFGIDIASISAFVNSPAYLRYFDSPNAAQQGGITTSMAGGSLVASTVAGFVSDHLGRKITLVIAAALWTVGAAIQCSVQNVVQLVFGRVIAGTGIGFATSQGPIYIAEISPRRMRGRLLTCFQWSVTWGIMIMFYLSGAAAFRLAWGLQMVPGVIYFAFLILLPESPRYLAKKQRWDEAHEILAKVNGQGDREDPVVKAEWSDLQDLAQLDAQSSAFHFWELFNKKNRVRTFVGATAQIWQQFTGMPIMMYYVVYIFLMAGFQGNQNLVVSSIQYVINTAMTLVPLVFIDKWGRRPLLIFGSAIMAAFFFIIGAVMGSQGHYTEEFENPNVKWIITNDKAAKAVIACSYIFVATFAATWGPGIWLYVSEIFPLRQRAKAAGFCASCNWSANFVLGFVVPIAIRNIQWCVYMIFGCFNLAMCLETFLLFPESANKTLEEMEAIWDSKTPAWRTYKLQSRVENAPAEISAFSEEETKHNDLA